MARTDRRKLPEVLTEEQIVEKAKEMTKGRNYEKTKFLPTLAEIDDSEGDTNKYTALAIRVMMLPTIDLNDTEALQNRVAEYFQMYADVGVKPTLNGLCNAIGLDHRRLREIATDSTAGGHVNGYVSSESRVILKKAYQIFIELHESYMQNGKINPVAGIFLAKNHFGYQDKVDYVITPNTKPEVDFNEDDISKRYLSGGETNDPGESN